MACGLLPYIGVLICISLDLCPVYILKFKSDELSVNKHLHNPSQDVINYISQTIFPKVIDCGGVSTRGHGQREGPVGSKLSRSYDADDNGRVRSERSERSPPQSLLSSRFNMKRKKVMKPKKTRMSFERSVRHICVFLG